MWPLPLPMKATAGSMPVGDDWRFEVKWDGMRAVVGVDDGVRLASVRGRDVTASFPEVGALGGSLGVDAVLDGELVTFVDGRPDFGRLQSRIHLTNPSAVAERAAVAPVVLVVFDLLVLDGRELFDLAWAERRRLLEALVDDGPHWQVPAVHDDGDALLSAATDADLEGVVAKRMDSRYRPGSRTKEWVKVKVRRRQEFVVGGWAPGTGNRDGRIGGLLVGYRDQPGSGPLRYAGRVGSGLSDAELTELAARFATEETDDCPFDPPPPRTHVRGARWVRPELVVEVGYAEWTGDGRLRHPTYVGRRVDVDPESVTAEP